MTSDVRKALFLGPFREWSRPGSLPSEARPSERGARGLPVTSCLQSRRVGDGSQRLAPNGAGFGHLDAGSRRLARARNVTTL